MGMPHIASFEERFVMSNLQWSLQPSLKAQFITEIGILPSSPLPDSVLLSLHDCFWPVTAQEMLSFWGDGVDKERELI
jgi:hypothetical protein